jgi:inorganic pyrophosphatase
MTISKYLSLGLAYPFDFGFFPSTSAEDGDPLDVMVLGDEGGFTGLVQKVRLVGALATEQKEKGATLRNDRILAVPVELSRRSHLKDARDLDAELRGEIELFLRATDVLEPKVLVFLGWKGPRAARRLVDEAARRYSGLRAPASKG